MSNDKWQPIETAPLDTPILILYFKGGKTSRTRVCKRWVITEAIGAMLYEHVTWRGSLYYSSSLLGWDGVSEGAPTKYVEWSDHLERLIVNTSSKVQKNIVKYWKPISYDGAFEVTE